MKTIGLFSGVLLFSLLCLLPEVRAECFASVSRMNYVKMYNKTIIEFGFHMIS